MSAILEPFLQRKRLQFHIEEPLDAALLSEEPRPRYGRPLGDVLGTKPGARVARCGSISSTILRKKEEPNLVGGFNHLEKYESQLG